MLEVKFKKLVPEAKIPAYAKPGDAGLDLTATSKHWSDDFKCWVYGTGLAVEIPEGYWEQFETPLEENEENIVQEEPEVHIEVGDEMVIDGKNMRCVSIENDIPQWTIIT